MNIFSSAPMTIIYTDGSCVGKQDERCGGWAARIHLPGQDIVSLSDGEHPPTTSSRMEILAAIKALEWLDERGSLTALPIRVITDSEYLANNFQYIATWRKGGWMTIASKYRQSQPVANTDLWEALDALASQVRGFHIYGIERDSDPENIECDKLAHAAAKAVQASLR